MEIYATEEKQEYMPLPQRGRGEGMGKNSLNTWKIGIERPMTGFRWEPATVR